MAKSYRAYVPEQDLLLPPSLRDWLPEDHLAYFVSDVVDQLDLRAIESVYEEEDRGQPPYHPRMMTKILLYGYCVGVFSSRRMQKKIAEDVGFRVLAAGNEPDFRTISDFRKLHLPVLEGLFDQVLQIALQAGTMKLGRVVLDGSKVKANASKHKAMSYGRMQEDEKRLKEEVKRLLQQAEAADAEEDARYGADRRGDELPAELARRETRLQRIREAKRALEERAREQAHSKGEAKEQAEKAKPEAKMQYNFSDPESRIMPGAEGFVQAYNTQIAVEPDFQLIVGQRVTQASNDKQQLVPTLEVIREQAGQTPQEVVTDSGYCSDANLKYLEKKKMEGFIATDRESYRDRHQPGPRGPLPKGATRVDRMRRKLQTQVGAAIYSKRKTVVEPVFGQIKQARGFRQFLLRGLEKVQGEWAMICLTHNILKLHRLCNG
ncbi:MAG: IS1182 family transposase [Acidobacteria bacterium]|nr:IS1182 family transposase [Acidobacteriota bacterium]